MKTRWLQSTLLTCLTLALMMMWVPNLQAAPKSKVTIEMGSSKIGSIGYVLIHATTELINKNSPWLRATFVETTGITENLKILSEEPARRKSFAHYAEVFTQQQAALGDRPFNRPYKTNKIIARMATMLTAIVTLDPKIKTVKDLIGKRVSVGPKGISIYWHAYRILHDGYGIWDKIKPEYLGFTQGKNALINGLIDASIQGSSIKKAGESPYKPKVVGLAPAGRELKDRKKPYIVSYDKADIDKARKKSGYPLYWVEIPAGTWGPNQPNPVGGELSNMTWSCDIEMPEEVVYEITRILYEHSGKFKDYHVVGRSISQAEMANVPGTEADFHPGAVKFYKEHRIKIGAPVLQ
ncbi:MAG: TAXI family TRAP transporter solute-binding subunit [Desulfatiglandales bacterium]|nr:TAXI family TRAP transporter solute-binding subunit [Desulfatiglandales bacterium]